MLSRSEIYDMIAKEISLCKGINEEKIKETHTVFKDLDILGDDFIFLADDFHRKANAKPSQELYREDMTVADWVDIIYSNQK